MLKFNPIVLNIIPLAREAELSDANALPAPKETTRLEKRGYAPKTARKPIVELTATQRLFLQYVLYGCDKRDLCEQVGVRPFEPMSVEQAADLCRIRRRFARWLFEQTAFKRAYAAGLEAIRSGYRVKALQTQGEIMQDAGDGSAAFAAVRLKASQALMGDSEGRGGTQVNVQVNNGPTLMPGVVIRLPAGVAAPPLERMAADGEIIDVTPVESSVHSDRIELDPETPRSMARNWPHVGGDE